MANKMKKIFILAPLVILLGLVGVYFLFPGATFDLLRAIERSAGGLKQHSIDVKGLRIEYLEGGKGDALVLLHGFAANKDNWTRFGKHLTPHFRVIAPDLPGFGESSADPDADYTISIQVERVKALVRALGITSLHLGGSSMGGSIAGAYASSYPEEVKSLLLLAPGGVASAEPSEMYRRLKEGKPNPLVAKSVEDYEHLLDFVFVKRPFIPRAIKKYLIQEAIEHQPLNSKIFKQLLRSSDVPPLEVLLDGLPVPTLIVWGAHDRVLHVSGAKILEAVMPKAKAEVMDAVGHLPMIEKPKKTAGLYLSFLEQSEPNLR
jgi:abhydrolase domain-containing protein 6